jgi:hypothetical protein
MDTKNNCLELQGWIKRKIFVSGKNFRKIKVQANLVLTSQALTCSDVEAEADAPEAVDLW